MGKLFLLRNPVTNDCMTVGGGQYVSGIEEIDVKVNEEGRIVLEQDGKCVANGRDEGEDVDGPTDIDDKLAKDIQAFLMGEGQEDDDESDEDDMSSWDWHQWQTPRG